MIGDKKEAEIEIVPKDTETVKCDGGEGDLGHPAVFFKMKNSYELNCNYCNKKFIKKD
jgi:uncharacterized Zn-finger protein